MKSPKYHRTISFDRRAWAQLEHLQSELGKSGPSATVAAALDLAASLLAWKGPCELVLTAAGPRLVPFEAAHIVREADRKEFGGEKEFPAFEDSYEEQSKGGG
jgi:hypothetical protein